MASSMSRRFAAVVQRDLAEMKGSSKRTKTRGSAWLESPSRTPTGNDHISGGRCWVGSRATKSALLVLLAGGVLNWGDGQGDVDSLSRFGNTNRFKQLDRTT